MIDNTDGNLAHQSIYLDIWIDEPLNDDVHQQLIDVNYVLGEQEKIRQQLKRRQGSWHQMGIKSSTEVLVIWQEMQGNFQNKNDGLLHYGSTNIRNKAYS